MAHSVQADQEAGLHEEDPLAPEQKYIKPVTVAMHRWLVYNRMKLQALLIGVVCFALVWWKWKRRHYGDPVPQPPEPYDYDTFLPWFDAQNWESYGFKMTPQHSWFDADMPLKTKASWFAGEDMTMPLAAVKHMDRFHFMQGIMLTGDDSLQAGMAAHLLFLRLMQPALNRDKVLYLDVGCGNGALMRLAAVMGRFKGYLVKPIGVDYEAANVAEAKRQLTSEEMRDPDPPASYVFQADAFDPDTIQRGLVDNAEKGAEDGTHYLSVAADIITVGAGVAASKARQSLSPGELALSLINEAPLKGLTNMLARGGILIAPICEDTPGNDGRCTANVVVLKKSRSGSISVQDGGNRKKAFGPSKWLTLRRSM